VAQIPALVISIAAGLIVSRVSTEEDIAGQMLSNIFNKTQALYITAAIIGLMGLIPGMPNFAFLLLAGGMAWLAYKSSKKPQVVTLDEQSVPAASVESQEASWEDVAPIDTLGLEVGYRLIPLVDNAADGELVRRIKGIRKKFAREIGFLPPAVHIRDNLEINPNAYRITLKGVEIGSGEVRTGLFLAIDPGNITASLPGVTTRDPAFGLPAVWV
jgi:flagellar biosynthesis protein FlhA